jgi:hypothetical protein
MRVVLADRVIRCGWVAVMDGRIVEIGEGARSVGRILPATFFSRPGGAHWIISSTPCAARSLLDAVAAIVSYDGQLATCSITPCSVVARVGEERRGSAKRRVANRRLQLRARRAPSYRPFCICLRGANAERRHGNAGIDRAAGRPAPSLWTTCASGSFATACGTTTAARMAA